MTTRIAAAIFAITALGACTGTKDKNAHEGAVMTDTTEVADVNMAGQWYIEEIVLDDSTNVRPGDETPGVKQCMVFTDSTYVINTNCNSISGPYYVKGDSITLGDGIMTEMACDNMATEDAIRKILPCIGAVEVENDSVARLNGRNQSEYILLRKDMSRETR